MTMRRKVTDRMLPRAAFIRRRRLPNFFQLHPAAQRALRRKLDAENKERANEQTEDDQRHRHPGGDI